MSFVLFPAALATPNLSHFPIKFFHEHASSSSTCVYVCLNLCYIILHRESGSNDDGGDRRSRFDGKTSAIFSGIGTSATR